MCLQFFDFLSPEWTHQIFFLGVELKPFNLSKSDWISCPAASDRKRIGEVTVLTLLGLLLVSSGDSRNSQEGVVGVSVPDQQLLVRRDRLRRTNAGRSDSKARAVWFSASRGRHTACDWLIRPALLLLFSFFLNSRVNLFVLVNKSLLWNLWFLRCRIEMTWSNLND